MWSQPTDIHPYWLSSSISKKSENCLNLLHARSGLLSKQSQIGNRVDSSDIPKLQEKLLVLQAQCRVESAFKQLVQIYEQRLLYYIRRIVGDHGSPDVLQEVWIKVFIKLPTLKAPEAFRVWLYKITHDMTVNHLRKQTRYKDFVEQHDPPDQLDDWNELELLERAELVHRALGVLSLSHREVLTLRFLEDLSLSEIAEVIGCSQGTVKSRLHYAKIEIRKTIKGISNE